jgi:5-methylcytosine-specific restriction endonuclease McrA
MWGEPLPTWRRAQKSYQCQGDGCTRIIAPGDRYLDKSLRDPKHGHLRYCQECAKPVLESAESYHFFRRNDFPERYQRHIASSRWKELRLKIIEQRGGKCQRCNSDSLDLELHHLHYRSLGNELPEDVELLCPKCHETADAARRPRRKDSDEGWIVDADGEHWSKFDPKTVYIPLPDGRYAPVEFKPKR